MSLAPTLLYPLSLHDALPISFASLRGVPWDVVNIPLRAGMSIGLFLISLELVMMVFILLAVDRDRKSTRLNSSHGYISYAVFCLKKKTKICATQNVRARNMRS